MTEEILSVGALLSLMMEIPIVVNICQSTDGWMVASLAAAGIFLVIDAILLLWALNESN